MSRSRDLAVKMIYEAFKILKENDNELPGKEVIEKVGERLEFDDWAKLVYETSGYVRWKTILHFYSSGCVKAGFLRKNNSIWYLTPEGEEALKLGAKGLMDKRDELYNKWKLDNPPSEVVENDNESEDDVLRVDSFTLDQIEQMAMSSIKNKVSAKNPYEFQDLVAALLRGMGYFTPFVAPRGPDGGIDIIAYRDPLGTTSPRVKVQIKHRIDKASVTEIRQLMGLLQKEGDVGLFISSGGFTPEAKKTAQSSHVHVELIDFEKFIALWQDFYNKMDDEDKTLLPLLPFYFYAEID